MTAPPRLVVENWWKRTSTYTEEEAQVTSAPPDLPFDS